MTYYGWRYEGENNGKHVAYFWNEGKIMASEFFATLQECLDFIKSWFTNSNAS